MFKKGFKFGLGLVVGLGVMDYAMGLILHKMNDQNKNHRSKKTEEEKLQDAFEELNEAINKLKEQENQND